MEQIEQLKFIIMKLRFLNTYFVFALLLIFGCSEKDDYNYNDIIPVVQGDILGSAEVVQTFSYDYTIGYRRGGSTWNWTVTGATIDSITDNTTKAKVKFGDYPANGIAYVIVSETTLGGKTSKPDSLKILVKKYCPLDGLADLVGSWSGDDAGYESKITIEITDDKLIAHGMNEGFIADFWGEEITERGTVVITVNEDGSIAIPRQYIFTTIYDGSPSRYEIIGSGTWDNCGVAPAFVIKYDIYYEGEEIGIAEKYSSNLGNIPYLTADISMSNSN
jgi:hypothetical protein